MMKLIIFVACFLYTTPILATNYCASTNIVNCFPAQEGSGTTLIDRSTNGNNGTFASAGNPAWAASAPSRSYITYSLNYTTGSQWVTIPNSTWTKPGQAQSIAYWFYPTANTNVRIWERNTSTSALSTSPAWAISVFIPAATTALLVISAGSTITQNAWNHIVMTWDGSSTASNYKIYINGTETTYSTQQNAVGAFTDNSGSTFYLGNRPAGDRNLQGKITDIAIFNRVLSSSEVSDIYNYGVGAMNVSTINNATVNNATIN